MRRLAWADLYLRQLPFLLLVGPLAYATGCAEPECQSDEVKVGKQCVQSHPKSDGGDESSASGEKQERDASKPTSSQTETGDRDEGSKPVEQTDAGKSAVDNRTDADAPPASCKPSPEECDGDDDDCDGVIDNGVKNACGGCDVISPDHAPDKPCSNGGTKECNKPGTWQCHGDTTICNAPDPTPSPEECDGRDNDCDGDVDEGFKKNSCGGCDPLDHEKGESCDNGLMGECLVKGTYACTTTEKTECNAPMKTGTPEFCDNKDNDCNGPIDDKASDAAPYYRDCDGDGYAGSKEGAVNVCDSSDLPKPTGTCKAWTDREPTGSTNTDCDPDNASYHPGADYGVPSGSNTSNDLNCDGQVQKLGTVTTTNSELALCDYPGKCNCYGVWARGTNTTVAIDWANWWAMKNSLAAHPDVPCSASQDDVLTIVRYTDSDRVLAPEGGCAYQGGAESGTFAFDEWTARQRCR